MWLSDDAFRQVVAATPLVAIDLVVRDTRGRVLLGRRKNRPAQGFWFVPGGRVRKNETLDAACERLTETELGLRRARGDAALLGVYEHMYADSVFGAVTDSPSTHYVLLGYQLFMADEITTFLHADVQHDEWRWWPTAEALTCTQVHAHSRAYLCTQLAAVISSAGRV